MVLGVIMGGRRKRLLSVLVWAGSKSESFWLRLSCGEGEIGIDADIERVGGSVFGGEEGGEGDHAGIVSGERGRGGLDFHAGVLGGEGEGILEAAITGYSSGQGDQGVAGFARGFDRFFDESIDDGFLKRGADIGEMSLGVVELLELVKNGCFEAGKGEVERAILEVGAGKDEGFGITLASVLFNFGSAGIGELEHAADFVEGFARCVVDGAPDELVLSVRLHVDEHGVTSGDDKTEVGRDRSVFEKGREEVAFHVVDSEEGFS